MDLAGMQQQTQLFLAGMNMQMQSNQQAQKEKEIAIKERLANAKPMAK
jgi:hypothetical protein